MQTGKSIFEFPDHLPEPGQTPCTLLERIRLADDVAWAHFSKLYGPLILYWCRKCDLKDEDAADIAQDVMLTISQKISSFRREKPGDTFRGWMWTITRSKVLNLYRATRSLPVSVGNDQLNAMHAAPTESIISESSAPPDYPASELYRRAIELIENEFEASTMRAFWLTAVEERAPAEVAHQLQMTVAAVYKAKSRVLKRLRDELDGFLE